MLKCFSSHFSAKVELILVLAKVEVDPVLTAYSSETISLAHTFY